MLLIILPKLAQLLLVCCLYTGGDWFFVAALWVLFGMGLLFLPYALRRLPLPPALSGRKASVYLAAETALLLLALGVNFRYSGVEEMFFTTAAAVLFGVARFAYAVALTAAFDLGSGLLASSGDWFIPLVLYVVFVQLIIRKNPALRAEEGT